MGLNEVDHKETMGSLSHIESVGVSASRAQQMSVTKIGLVFVPSSDSDEVITVDDIKLVHFLTAFAVKTKLVEVNSAWTVLVDGLLGGVCDHENIVDHLDSVWVVGV